MITQGNLIQALEKAGPSKEAAVAGQPAAARQNFEPVGRARAIAQNRPELQISPGC